jgi:hypothetical protein
MAARRRLAGTRGLGITIPEGALSVGVDVKPTGIGFARRRPRLSGQRSEPQDDDERGAKTTHATGAVADCKRDV